MKQLFTLKPLLCPFAKRRSKSKKFLLALIIITVLDVSIAEAQTNSVVFTGAGTYNWNSLPWSEGHAPLISEDVVITFNLATNGAASVIINATTISANSITIEGNWGGTGKKTLGVVADAVSTTAIISDLILYAAGGTVSVSNPSEVYFISDGTVSVGGNVSVGATGTNKASIGANSSSAVYTFYGNVIFGMNAATYASGKFIFDGTGVQAFSRNNTTYRTRLQTVQVGGVNTPSVIITGNSSDGLNGGDLTINTGAFLLLPDGSILNQDNSGTGTFTNDGSIQISGSSGGFAGSNFPRNFSGYLFNPASTTEFDGLADQSIPNIDYGNLTITNNSTKTLAGPLKVFGNLLINPGAILDVSVNNYTLTPKANWTNNGIFIPGNGTVSFNNTVAGNNSVFSGNTTFYDLVLTNDNGTTDFGATTQIITHSFSTSGGIMNGGASTFIFSGNTSIIGPNSKNFFNLLIDGGSTVDHLTGGGNIHVANSFINNGNFTDRAIYTFYFDKSGAVETMSGTGITSFGKLAIGDAGFSFATTLNCNVDFTLTGGNISLYNGSIFKGNNTIICSTNPCIVSGTGTCDFYNVTANVPVNFGTGTTMSNIRNNLLINPAGSVITNAPFYNSATTLIYNTTDALFNTGPEWTGNTGSTGKGSPYNITINNTNHILLSGSRTVPGVLNIGPVNSVHINGFVLTANGPIAGGGTLTGSPGSGLVLSKNGNVGVLYFTPNILPSDSGNYLKTLIINAAASATLGNALNIAAGSYADAGVLAVDGTLNTNGFLTLKSDASGDARVGFSTGIITGETMVERYIPATRAWRFLSVPFSATNENINQAWQESQTNTSVSCSYVDPTPAGLGTQLTGIGSIAGSGFDFNNTGNPSLRYWDNLSWQSPSSTLGTNKLTDHPAWYVFIRGDRHICLNGVYPPNVTTLRAKGTLIQQGGVNATAYTFSGSANQWFMAGNPYASPINLQNVINGSRVDGFQADKIWVMDPKLTGSYGVGGYATYSSGVWAGASYPGPYGNQPIIQSGQGFMVYTNSTVASVQLQEADKTPTQSSVFGLMASPAKKPKQFPVVYASLMSADTSAILDGVASGFDRSFSASVDEKDAQKLWNVGENMALIRHDTALAIEFRPIPKTNDTLFYRLYLRQQPYVLKIFTANINAEVPAEGWLVDKYLDTQTPVKLGDTTLYAFAPNPDTNSYRNRFMLVFNRSNSEAAVSLVSSINEKNILSNTKKVQVYPNPVTRDRITL